MPWPSEEAKQAYYKKRNKKQRQVVYLFIVAPILIGIFSALTGLWFVWPIILFSGIFYAIYLYAGMKGIGFSAAFMLFMIIIILAQ